MKRTTRTAKRGTTTDLQVRGVPVGLRETVRARAAKKGQTMSQYMIDLIRSDTDRSSLEEWLEKVRRNRIPVASGMSAAQALREARGEREEHLAHVLEESTRRTRR